MPGIVNKYFRIAALALSVSGMASAPYALGVFRRPAPASGGEFTGLVVGDRVRDISALGTIDRKSVV